MIGPGQQQLRGLMGKVQDRVSGDVPLEPPGQLPLHHGRQGVPPHGHTQVLAVQDDSHAAAQR